MFEYIELDKNIIMKFLKLTFSKLLFVGLSIICQIIFFIATNFWLSKSFWWVNDIFSLLSIIVLIVIINKDKPASFKLPWIVIVLIFPIVGLTLYFLFGNYNLSKKTIKKINEEQEKLRQYCLENEEAMYYLMSQNYLGYGQARYIQNACNLPTYNHCYSEYLPTGEKFFEKLVYELKRAKSYIFMEYFIIDNGYMLDTIIEILEKKAREGVKVYFMYDDLGSVSKVSSDYDIKLRDKGIYACKFNRIRPIITVSHNNRDHRKITVIDGEIGFVGGANLADEYINVTHPYGRWLDNAIMLKGSCVNSLIIMFIKLYNINSVKKLDVKDFIVEHQQYDSKGYITPYSDEPSPLDRDYVGMNVYLNIINQAQEYVYITTPYLIVDFDFIEALVNASKRGVDVKIITPGIPDKKIIKILTKSNYEKLINNGIEIYEYIDGFIHSKMFICDDKIATIGTINLDYRSFIHHFECGVWMYGTSCVKDMYSDYIYLINNETNQITINNSKLNNGEKLIKNILKLFSPLL